MGANSLSIQQEGTVGSASGIKIADGTVLAANPRRLWWGVINLDDAACLAKKGANASTTDFHGPLKACAAADDGSGGAYFDASWKGIVSIKAAAGASRVSVIEMEQAF